MRAFVSDRPRWRDRPLVLCLVLALALHVVGAVGVRLWVIRSRAASAKISPPIRLMDRRHVQHALRQARQRQEKSEQKEAPDGRVVSLPPPERHEKNDRARLLAADAHRVERETISRERELSDKEVAAHRQERQAPKSTPALPPSVQEAPPSADLAPAARKISQRPATNAKRKRAAPVAAPAPPRAAPTRIGPHRALGLTDLMPSVAQLAQQAAAPVADVSSDDAPEGDVTGLNTRSFRFAGFFDRVSQRLRPHWHIYDALADVQRRGQALLQHETYRTTVHVVLDERGQLVSATVRDPSGISEFDAAGKGAIEQAAPYLHPPTGLLDAARQVSIDITFGLSLEPGNLLEGLNWRQDLP